MCSCPPPPPLYFQCDVFERNLSWNINLARCLPKREIKKVIFMIPLLWWLIIIGCLDILTWIYTLSENINIYINAGNIWTDFLPIKTTRESNTMHP